MSACNAENHRRHNYALLARDIRRLTAMIHRAEIDGDTREMIDSALEQLEGRVWLMSFHEPAGGVLIQDQDVYSDGRPVTTMIDWGSGFATLVHCSHPRDETSRKAEELSEEVWPTGAMVQMHHIISAIHSTVPEELWPEILRKIDGPVAADTPADEFEDYDDAEDEYDPVESARTDEYC